MSYPGQSQSSVPSSSSGQHVPNRNWQAIIQYASAQFQSLDAQIYQHELGAATQKKYWEQQVGQLQVELESERRNSDTIKQQLTGTEEHLKTALAEAESQRQRASILEESARKIARDAERVILEMQGTPDGCQDGQLRPIAHNCIAQIFFESGHNAAVLRMREKMDSGGREEAAEMLHKLGNTNLELEKKVQRIRTKREQALVANRKLLEDNAALAQKVIEGENEIAVLKGGVDVDQHVERERPRRKKRKTQAD